MSSLLLLLLSHLFSNICICMSFSIFPQILSLCPSLSLSFPLPPSPSLPPSFLTHNSLRTNIYKCLLAPRISSFVGGCLVSYKTRRHGPCFCLWSKRNSALWYSSSFQPFECWGFFVFLVCWVFCFFFAMPAYFCLRTFVLAIPSAFNVLPLKYVWQIHLITSLRSQYKCYLLRGLL